MTEQHEPLNVKQSPKERLLVGPVALYSLLGRKAPASQSDPRTRQGSKLATKTDAQTKLAAFWGQQFRTFFIF